MNTSTTNSIQKACKPGQLKVRKHHESFISEKIGSQDLLIGTPELRYNKMGDQHLWLKKPHPAEFQVHPEKIKEGLVYHNEAVQPDLAAEQITRMEQAPFNQRFVWIYHEMIVQSSFTLAYLPSHVT